MLNVKKLPTNLICSDQILQVLFPGLMRAEILERLSQFRNLEIDFIAKLVRLQNCSNVLRNLSAGGCVFVYLLYGHQGFAIHARNRVILVW